MPFVSVFRDILFFGIRLAGKTADEQVEIGHSCCINSCNVVIINLSLRVINGFVSRRSVLVYFAIPDTFKAARLLETAAKTADPRKAVEKFNCYKITPLQIFALILHRHFRFLNLGLLCDLVELIHLGTDPERSTVVEIHENSTDIVHK